MRKVSDAGAQFIAKHEGYRSTAYKDAAGVWTIGYGHTGYVKFYGKNVCAGMTITKEQALELLKDDLAKAEKAVNKYYSRYTWNQNEFDALVSFAFNIGNISGLTANGIRTKGVIAVKFSEYNKGRVNGVLKELPGLTTRRNAERELFLKGVLGTETGLESTAGLTADQIKANILIVQKWINKSYADALKASKLTGYSLLTEDGKMGNKTRAALTIVLQTYLNVVHNAGLKIDGEYGAKTNEAVKKYIAVKLGTNGVISKLVQASLYCYGYNPQTFSNEFNANSMTALIRCQTDNNLNSDGVAGVVYFTTFFKQR